MKQRFVVTLLAVAIASLSASAYAIAPVINDFRSPIIADDTPVTNSNVFVYPDVFDLNTKANDPDLTVTPANIIWSFTGDGTYRINNRLPMNLGGGDNPNAPGTKSLAAGDDPATSGTTQDANVRTITFRNNALSPVGGPNVDPITIGILPAQTKLVTLFASDGSSYTQKSFLVYTYNNGADALSGKSLTPYQALTTPAAGTTAWTSSNLIGTTTFSSGANGLCVQVPTTGANFGGWSSPYGIIALAKNNVYRVRIDVAGVPTIAQSATPLWDFVFDNVAPSAAQQKFSTDIINWDTFGGANAAGPTTGGRHIFDLWWAPLPIQAADWNDATNGEFRPANDAFNDVRFQYRILDVGAVDSDNDSGTLCLRSTTIDRIDIADLAIASTAYNNANLTAVNTTVSTIFPTSTNKVYAAGKLTLTPTTPGVGTTPPAPPTSAGSWGVEIITVDVGDATVNFGTPSSLTDNWPIPWVSNQLLKTEAGVTAPDSTGQSNPPDVIRLMMDAPTNEIGQDSLVSSGANLLGMPKTASETIYTAFYHTQNKTLNATPEFQALRPRFSLLCVDAVLSGGTSNVNNGGATLNFLRVNRIDVSGFN
jgi:hypothetical protein